MGKMGVGYKRPIAKHTNIEEDSSLAVILMGHRYFKTAVKKNCAFGLAIRILAPDIPRSTVHRSIFAAVNLSSLSIVATSSSGGH
jgi:hypothetical protein